MRTCSIHPAALATIFSLFCNNAMAQFVGDVFFSNPSVLAPETGQVELELSTFAGNKPFGAMRAEIAFDSTKIQVVDVSSGAAGPLVRWESGPDTVKILAINGASLTGPIGTVVLARIKMKVLAQAGTQISITSLPVEGFYTDSAAIRKGIGYSAQISVGAAAATPLSHDRRSSTVVAESGSTVEKVARSLRPAGHELHMYVPRGAGTFSGVNVKTAVDHGAVKEKQ